VLCTKLGFKQKTRALTYKNPFIIQPHLGRSRHNEFVSIVKNETGRKHKHAPPLHLRQTQPATHTHTHFSKKSLEVFVCRSTIAINSNYLPTCKMHLQRQPLDTLSTPSSAPVIYIEPSNSICSSGVAQRPRVECRRDAHGACKNSHFAFLLLAFNTTARLVLILACRE
jgi:hypothetical protein